MKYAIIVINRRFLTVLFIIAVGLYSLRALCAYCYEKGMRDLLYAIQQQTEGKSSPDTSL